MRTIQILLAAIAAIFLVQCGAESAGPAEPSEGPAGTNAAAACVAEWDPAWQQRSGANNWWVEYGITGGTVSSAHLEVVGVGNVALSLQWNKWVGRSSFFIPTGTPVIVHAESSSGQKAQTATFGYLQSSQPLTDPCAGEGGGACTWDPSWQQGSRANNWWVEYVIGGGTVTAARLEIVGGGTVTLTSAWNKWGGSSSTRIPTGASVIVHATRADGSSAQTAPFGYLVDTRPETGSCGGGGGGGGTAPGAADVYDPNKVLTYELTFDAAAMAVLSSTAEADEKTWVRGTFKSGATTLADVGVRRKGSSTFRALPRKAALKIRFDRYVPGQTFAGFTDLTLNNSMSDPTFLVERLSYHVFRSVGLPAQRASSAQVVINGARYGLYLNVETPNEQLMNRLFGANGKTLYEVNYGSQWRPGVEGGFEEEVGDDTKADVSALLAAVAQAENATLLADVAGNLNTDQWLRFSATEAAVGHYDGYGFGIWGSHNYFMAGDVNGRFSLLPWSTDLTMSNRATVVDANVPLDTTGGGPTLLGRCKLSAMCWAAYKERVRTVLAAYEGLGLVELARSWHAQIDPLVIADPKREASLSYYTSETSKLYTWLAARPGVVRAQLGLTP